MRFGVGHYTDYLWFQRNLFFLSKETLVGRRFVLWGIGGSSLLLAWLASSGAAAIYTLAQYNNLVARILPLRLWGQVLSVPVLIGVISDQYRPSL